MWKGKMFEGKGRKKKRGGEEWWEGRPSRGSLVPDAG